MNPREEFQKYCKHFPQTLFIGQFTGTKHTLLKRNGTYAIHKGWDLLYSKGMRLILFKRDGTYHIQKGWDLSYSEGMNLSF